MMGFGSLGNGGSSSPSSNLSALAPPFTVDRSNSKPNPNPLAHLAEPSYGVPFHSSFHNWQYSQSSASRPDFYSNLCLEVDSIRTTPDLYSNIGLEIDSIRTTCLPSTNDYQYLDSHSVTSPSIHLSPLNLDVSGAPDTFTYSSDVASNRIEAKSYYPPFVSAVVDDDIPLVALNEPNYDLLSTPCVSTLGGTSHVDYANSLNNLTGLEYVPRRSSHWNRVADKEQDTGLEIGKSFRAEEAQDAGSNVYKNYMKQGACTADSSCKGEDAYAVSHGKYADVLGRVSQIMSPNAGNLNDISFTIQDPRFISSESSRTSISGMNSKLLESHAQVPSLESASNFWNNQNLYSGSYDKCFQSLESCINDHISVKNSPFIIGPPSVRASSKVPNTVSAEDVYSIRDVAAITNDFDSHDPSNQKDNLWSLSFGKGCLDISQPSLQVERTDFASSRKEEFSNTDGFDQMSKTRAQFQRLSINAPDGITLALDNTKGCTSMEDFDHYNPVVDSPCWKGAPASRVPPSEVSEAVLQQHLKRKSELSNSLDLQQTQISAPFDDTVKVSYQNLSENSVCQGNGYVELGSLLCPERLSNVNCPASEHSSADAVKARLEYSKPSSSNGVQFHNDINKPRKENDMHTDSESDSDLNPSHTQQPGLDKGDFASETFKLCTDVAEAGLITNGATEDGSAVSHGAGSSHSTYSGEDINKLPKLNAPVSMSKMNAKMLVNTIHSLSELLLFHCSNDTAVVSEEDQEALKHVIKNLDACVSKKTPTWQSMFTQLGTSHQCRNFPDLHKGVTTAGRPLVTKEMDVSCCGQFGHHCMHEEKRNSDVSVKEVWKFPDLVPSRVYADTVKDDNMVQSIKEVLKKDFDGEEEMQSETLLYKNLWLEAEAALCSINYRARFNRMKIEMEKFKSHKGKEVAESTKAVEKQLNSEVSPVPTVNHEVAPQARNSPMLDHIQGSPVSSPSKEFSDVEASVLARLQILKRRGENSNSVNSEGIQLAEALDTGFAGNTNRWAFMGRSEDRSSKATVGTYSQYRGASSKVEKIVGPYTGNSGRETKVDKMGSSTTGGGGSGHETMKELYATDDQVIQSDWEHV